LVGGVVFAGIGVTAMQTTYCAEDDILVLDFMNKPIVKEVSQDWNVNVSYSADGEAVEIAILDAKASGFYPVKTKAA
jgi:hypothetical protein